MKRRFFPALLFSFRKRFATCRIAAIAIAFAFPCGTYCPSGYIRRPYDSAARRVRTPAIPLRRRAALYRHRRQAGTGHYLTHYLSSPLCITPSGPAAAPALTTIFSVPGNTAPYPATGRRQVPACPNLPLPAKTTGPTACPDPRRRGRSRLQKPLRSESVPFPA